MKRALASICVLFLLASCARQDVFTPAEVMQRAGVKSGTLSSAHFNVHATFDGATPFFAGTTNGTVDAGGDMQNAGNQLSFTIKATAHDVQNPRSASGSLQADVIVAAQNDVYVKIDSLNLHPQNDLLPDSMIPFLTGRWWKMPAGSGTSLEGNVTPDPDLLNMQMQVISVVKDDGPTTVDGHNAYHYDVAIDHDKLAQYMSRIQSMRGSSGQLLDLAGVNATGQIWIDADTFDVHRLNWDLTSHDPVHPLHVVFTVDLTDQNNPVTIVPPEDAQPFPLSGLMPTAAAGSGSASASATSSLSPGA